MSFWLRAFWLITSCFGSLFRHASHILESFPKMISLYLCCVSTIAFSRSSLVFIQFWRGIFNSIVSCNNFFIYSFTCNNLFIYLFISNCSILNIRQTCSCLPLATQNIHYHHLNHLTYYSAGFLHQCIYTLQHIPEDGSFHLICIQGQLLTILLRCNTGDMNVLTVAIFLNLFFPRFRLTMDISTFSFYMLCRQLLT